MTRTKLALASLLMALAALVATAAPASAAISNPAYPVKQNGPGLKNWRCLDPDSAWRGPWRYTRAGAYIDCESYNGRA